MNGAGSVSAIIFNHIPFQIELAPLTEKLRVRGDSKHVDDLERMVKEAQSVGKPKAMYKAAFLDSRGEDHVVVNGVTLTSRVLSVNLKNAYRVFPYVATCGRELDDWSKCMDDMLARYWADTIKEVVLRCALGAVGEHLAEKFRPGKTSRMSPGSLEDWPIEEQRPLFSILGNTEGAVGVHLTDSLLMIPTRSVSGIFFPTETSFESCQLCAREKCPGRRAPYDSGLYDRKYRKRN
jgi:hypothetical protein